MGVMDRLMLSDAAWEWQQDCIADTIARGYVETGRTRSNTLLVRG